MIEETRKELWDRSQEIISNVRDIGSIVQNENCLNRKEFELFRDKIRNIVISLYKYEDDILKVLINNKNKL